jgi:hypothetical protein
MVDYKKQIFASKTFTNFEPKATSLIQRYLRNNMRQSGYDILNSMSKASNSKQTETTLSFKHEEFECEVKPDNTTITLKKKMEMLSDLNNQDIEKWVKKFRCMTTECHWDEQKTLSVLQSIIDHPYSKC